MDKYNETFKTWNKLASLYQDKFMDLTLYNESYDLFCISVPKMHARILEIGCGPGNITKYLLSARQDFDILGIDVAPNMVELARKNNPAARFEVLDCRHIHTLKYKYDGIVCGFCLPYLSNTDAQKFIADCYDLLNENGMFYISFVKGSPGESGFKMSNSGDRVFFNYYDLDDLTRTLNQNKFEIIKVMDVEYSKAEANTEIHTILIAKKQ